MDKKVPTGSILDILNRKPRQDMIVTGRGYDPRTNILIHRMMEPGPWKDTFPKELLHYDTTGGVDQIKKLVDSYIQHAPSAIAKATAQLKENWESQIKEMNRLLGLKTQQAKRPMFIIDSLPDTIFQSKIPSDATIVQKPSGLGIKLAEFKSPENKVDVYVDIEAEGGPKISYRSDTPVPELIRYVGNGDELRPRSEREFYKHWISSMVHNPIKAVKPKHQYLTGDVVEKVLHPHGRPVAFAIPKEHKKFKRK